eukprot:5517115-Alexandrium_andersonii.AAC.1
MPACHGAIHNPLTSTSWARTLVFELPISLHHAGCLGASDMRMSVADAHTHTPGHTPAHVQFST